MENNNYYVYAYTDVRKEGSFIYGELSLNFEPIYIGKGKNDRYRSHLKCAFKVNNKLYNSHFYRKIRKIKNRNGIFPKILIIKSGLTEEEAINYEKFLIKLIGREDKGLGPLCNMTDGGEGLSNPPEYVIEMKRKFFRERWKDPNYRAKMIEMSKAGKITEEQRIKMVEGRKRIEYRCSKETKIKISLANKGHTLSSSGRKKLSDFFKGRVVSEGTRKKISNSLKGHKLKQETKIKLSIALKGRIVTEETRKKMSIAFTGRKHSIEAKNKMSAAKRGRKLSDEQKILIGNRHRGEKKSEETRLKMSEAAKIRWQKRGCNNLSKVRDLEGSKEGMLSNCIVG